MVKSCTMCLKKRRFFKMDTAPGPDVSPEGFRPSGSGCSALQVGGNLPLGGIVYRYPSGLDFVFVLDDLSIYLIDQ